MINKEFKYPEITIKELNNYYKRWYNRFQRVSKRYFSEVEHMKKRLKCMNERFEHWPPFVCKCYDYSYRNNINKNLQTYFLKLFEDVQH